MSAIFLLAVAVFIVIPLAFFAVPRLAYQLGKMKSALRNLGVAGLGIGIAMSALAGNAGDDLGACMTSSTTGRDRIHLAQWAFAVMTLHPQLKQMSNTTDEQRDRAGQQMGALFTRLLTKDCKLEASAAIKEDQTTFERSFQTMGMAAMQEIYSNRDVANGMAQFPKYLDKEAFARTFREH
jgi:hypothetical protein